MPRPSEGDLFDSEKKVPHPDYAGGRKPLPTREKKGGEGGKEIVPDGCTTDHLHLLWKPLAVVSGKGDLKGGRKEGKNGRHAAPTGGRSLSITWRVGGGRIARFD